jgi:hypothetical protein
MLDMETERLLPFMSTTDTHPMLEASIRGFAPWHSAVMRHLVAFCGPNKIHMAI